MHIGLSLPIVASQVSTIEMPKSLIPLSSLSSILIPSLFAYLVHCLFGCLVGSVSMMIWFRMFRTLSYVFFVMHASF